MTYARPSATARSMPRHHAASPLPRAYCPIPQSLITNLHDTPLAIGLYALIGRLYLVHQSPIPLSRADVMRYDPTLKTGAVKRAFDRLVDGGWLIAAVQDSHHKQRYTPTWGRVKGEAFAWRMDQPCLGRPRHIIRLGVDRSLLDICMGKLTPHATQAGTITRYVTTPALSLSDVGCYALTLAELPHETPGLRHLGVVRHGQALPLPSEEHLLARISQRSLILDNATDGHQPELTISGTRRLGLHPQPPIATPQSPPLFFVPPSLIGSVIGSLIGSQIGQGDQPHGPTTAPGSAKMHSDTRPEGITWEESDQAKQRDHPLTPQVDRASQVGGGGNMVINQLENEPRAARARRRRKETVAPTVPDNETTQLLQTINVLPEQLLELAELPSDVVKQAIADGQARPGVRDLAGWVVKLLRSHRDYGWTLPEPRAVDHGAELLASFARVAEEDRQTVARILGDGDWQLGDGDWGVETGEQELEDGKRGDLQPYAPVAKGQSLTASPQPYAPISNPQPPTSNCQLPTANLPSDRELLIEALTDRIGTRYRGLLARLTFAATDQRLTVNCPPNDVGLVELLVMPQIRPVFDALGLELPPERVCLAKRETTRKPGGFRHIPSANP